MNFFVMTLFPQMINSYCAESIIKRAIENKIINVKTYDIREFSKNKHKKVDDYPYGGGAGMVMTPQPIYDTFLNIKSECKKNFRVVYLTPKGKIFNQKIAKEFSNLENLVLLCGHYEGIDQRVLDEIVTDEISLGDYVLTGGELGALILIDSVSRLIPGVLGKEESFQDESFSNNLLEYPHYTRPAIFLDKEVPNVLLSGNHKKIQEWRLKESISITKQKRPDLFENFIKNSVVKK